MLAMQQQQQPQPLPPQMTMYRQNPAELSRTNIYICGLKVRFFGVPTSHRPLSITL